MSLTSMTGHGRASARSGEYLVDVELSTTNRKQLDIHVSLPRDVASLESKVHAEVKRAIERGRVSGRIVLKINGSSRKGRVSLDEAKAADVLEQLRGMGKRLQVEDDLRLSDVMRIPDVMAFEGEALEADAVWPICKKVLSRALKELQAMRRREGEMLEADLLKRITKMRVGLSKIEKRAPGASTRQRKKVLSRIKEAGVQIAANDPSLLKEIALYADGVDITEELIRLNSHFKQWDVLIKKNVAVGRSLDFLAQEMLREINTVGSKSSDVKIAHEVVHFKAELEKLREQVQNIE